MCTGWNPHPRPRALGKKGCGTEDISGNISHMSSRDGRSGLNREWRPWFEVTCCPAFSPRRKLLWLDLGEYCEFFDGVVVRICVCGLLLGDNTDTSRKLTSGPRR